MLSCDLGFNEQTSLSNMYDLLHKSLDMELPELSVLSGDTNSTFMDKYGNLHIQVRVPTSEHVAEIVGKQGCKIKSLRYTTKTFIQTPARDQEPVFTICGDPGDVERAKLRIEEAAEHFTKIRQGRDTQAMMAPQLGPNAVVRYVKVPLKYVGLVVGPKGHNIKRIQSETDTYIMTPARDKEPVFEIKGAPEKVAEAEKKVQMYIAMRTGGLIGDHPGEVDLKKPMLPPSIISPLPPSQTWGKPEPNLYQKHYEKLDQPSSVPSFDPSKIDMDSGYSSPCFDSMKDWQTLKLFLDQIQQQTRTSPQLDQFSYQRSQTRTSPQQYPYQRAQASSQFFPRTSPQPQTVLSSQPWFGTS